MTDKFTKKENGTFSITLQKETIERIRFIRKIANNNNDDAYKNLDLTIFKWLLEQEKKYGVRKDDHKSTMFCPECNSKLRIVHTKSGDFIGCSGFPKCKYSKNLK